MALTVYGLKNCDTCKKAIKWLDAKGVDYTFSDLRKDGFEAVDLERWLEAVGIDILLNKRGTTWRGLEESVKESVSQDNVSALMIDSPALMKRPIFDFGDDVIVGFTAKHQTALVEKL